MSVPDVQFPINSYGWLKKAVALWIDRDDDEFVKQIPNFINFAEKEIYRNLRIPPIEKEAYLSILDGIASIPPDLLETNYIMKYNNGQMLRVTSLEEVDWLRRDKIKVRSDWNKSEIVFARAGKRFLFYPSINADIPPPQGRDDPPVPIPENAIIINYYADSMPMMNDEDTNTLLTIAPELLLYFALRHACLFVQDDNGVQKWSAMGNALLEEMIEQARKAEYAGSPLVIPNTYETLTSSNHYGYLKTYL